MKKVIIPALIVATMAGCATSRGQVGSNAAYSYERNPSGTCRVTVYSGREQIEKAAIGISEECKLTVEVQNASAGATNAALIGAVNKLTDAVSGSIPR